MVQENPSLWVCDQLWFNPTCSASETSLHFDILHEARLAIENFRVEIGKALNRLADVHKLFPLAIENFRVEIGKALNRLADVHKLFPCK